MGDALPRGRARKRPIPKARRAYCVSVQRSVDIHGNMRTHPARARVRPVELVAPITGTYATVRKSTDGSVGQVGIIWIFLTEDEARLAQAMLGVE